MLTYGKKKRGSSKLHSHDKCGVCEEMSKTGKKRARRMGREDVEEQVLSMSNIDEMRSLLAEMGRVMSRIEERKKEMVKDARSSCCPRCGDVVGSVDWYVTVVDMRERLLCGCKCGNEWFHGENPDGSGACLESK